MLEAIKEIKAEMDKPQSDPVIVPLQRYFDMRNANAYSQRTRVSNLKELNTMSNYLKANEIYTIEDLESRVSELKHSVDVLKIALDKEIARMKEIRKMPEYSAAFKQLKSVYNELQKIKFAKAKEKYKAEHAAELRQFYAAKRKIKEFFPNGIYDSRVLDKEYAELEAAHKDNYTKFVAIREEYQHIWHIQTCVIKGRTTNEQTQQQKKKSQEQEI